MITPSDSPSSPQHYAAVPVQGMDIQAPMDLAEIQSAYDQAGADAAAGVSAYHHQSPRQAQTEALLASPPGYSDFTILGGTTAGWPADVTP